MRIWPLLQKILITMRQSQRSMTMICQERTPTSVSTAKSLPGTLAEVEVVIRFQWLIRPQWGNHQSRRELDVTNQKKKTSCKFWQKKVQTMMNNFLVSSHQNASLLNIKTNSRQSMTFCSLSQCTVIRNSQKKVLEASLNSNLRAQCTISNLISSKAPRGSSLITNHSARQM